MQRPDLKPPAALRACGRHDRLSHLVSRLCALLERISGHHGTSESLVLEAEH